MVKRIKINVPKGKHAQFWRDQWKDEVVLSSHFPKLYPLLGKQLAFNNQSRIPSSCWDLIVGRNPNDGGLMTSPWALEVTSGIWGKDKSISPNTLYGDLIKALPSFPLWIALLAIASERP
ncbi:hypothetical protein SDJN03_27862, partial [Cucurbita argyrosperma subsp. sororia]